MAKKHTTTWRTSYELTYPGSVLEEHDPVFRGRKRWDMPVPDDVALTDEQLEDAFDRGKKKRKKKPA